MRGTGGECIVDVVPGGTELELKVNTGNPKYDQQDATRHRFLFL